MSNALLYDFKLEFIDPTLRLNPAAVQWLSQVEQMVKSSIIEMRHNPDLHAKKVDLITQ